MARIAALRRWHFFVWFCPIPFLLRNLLWFSNWKAMVFRIVMQLQCPYWIRKSRISNSQTLNLGTVIFPPPNVKCLFFFSENTKSILISNTKSSFSTEIEISSEIDMPHLKSKIQKFQFSNVKLGNRNFPSAKREMSGFYKKKKSL